MTAEELAVALEEKHAEMRRAAETLLSRYGLARDDAEDFLQDASLRLLGKVDQLTVGELPGLYYHTIRGLIKNRVRDEQLHDSSSDEYQILTIPDSQAQMQQRERLNNDVGLALDMLNTRTRQIVELIWLEGYNWKQTAKAVNCSERDVQTALDTAKSILQTALTQYAHRRRLPSSPIVGNRGKISQPPYRQGSDKEASYDTPVERHSHHWERAQPIRVTKYDAKGQMLSMETMPARLFRKLAREQVTSHVSLVSPPLSNGGLETPLGETLAA